MRRETEELLRQEIARKGDLNFAEFMELALYHPQWGYYSKNSASQDYFTNVDVHSIFAEILAHFFTITWEKNFKDGPFTLVELGCGNGKLARQILKTLSQNQPLFNRLQFIGIEKSASRLSACQEIKEEFGDKINFRSQFNFPQNSLNGILYSNEFFDALPVHRVFKKGNILQEEKLATDANFSLIPILKPLSLPVQEYFSWLREEPQGGCYGEAHLASREWMQKMGQALKKGTILTIDYGFPAAELYSSFRTEGTALCHFQNKTNRNFYEKIGDQDITAHINFTVLEKEGKTWGLEPAKLQTQTDFLTRYGLEKMVGGAPSPNLDEKSKLKRSLAIRTLLHPEGMGGTFKIFLQQKGGL